ncbi:MAG: imidazolonepropionase [Thiolinea sp.]
MNISSSQQTPFPTTAVDTLWLNARLATMEVNGSPYGLLDEAAIAVSDGKISWLGKTGALPANYPQRCTTIQDCRGQLVTPGLVDCHTHLVYGGNRAREFEMRLQGASYEAIANTGGGIVSTVTATRSASEAELYDQSAPRLEAIMEGGATTIEIKSGYGLNVKDELKMLRVARQLGQDYPVDIVTTFLGAHALPVEFSGRSDKYIDLVCREILPAVAAENLADHVDAFCEGIAFSPQQVARVFDTAHQYDLPVKLHAEQLSDLKGAVLAAEHKALSVDHLEYLAAEDVPVLSVNNTTTVLLPGAFYYLRETKLPPIAALREHNVPIALATDSNPGSSPMTSLPLLMNMACTFFHLTPEEALAGVTRHGAQALGLSDKTGTLSVGKQADLICWQAHDPAELSYRIGDTRCQHVLYRGKVR